MDDTLKYVLFPLQVRNPVASVERLARLGKSKAATGRFAQNALPGILQTELTEREAAVIASLLREDPQLAKVWARNGSRLNVPGKSTDPEVPAGRTNCLFVADPDQDAFGCVHPITVTAVRDGKGETNVLGRDSSEETLRAIDAAREALRYVLSDYGLQQRGYRNLDNYRISVQVGDLGAAYDGGSLGLAVAVSLLSALLKSTVPPAVAFTGLVRNNGEVEAVRGLQEKLRAAELKGMSRVYMPSRNGLSSDGAVRIDLTPVASLKEVFDGVFGEDVVRGFADLLNETAATKEPEGNSFETDQSRLLAAPVGNRDPHGRSYQPGGSEEYAEGPVLTAFRKIRPDAVLLLPTKETYGSALACVAAIEGIAPACECRIRSVEVEDPTDYDQLYEAALAAIRGARDLFKNRIAFLAISAGTPQMHTVLLNLIQRKKVEARLVQVREPKFAKSWDDRVRIVRSEYLGIGT